MNLNLKTLKHAHLVVLDVVEDDVDDTQGLLHSYVILTHLIPSKYCPSGQEQPSTKGARQHLLSVELQVAFCSQVTGIVMFALYPASFLQGRQQGSSERKRVTKIKQKTVTFVIILSTAREKDVVW